MPSLKLLYKYRDSEEHLYQELERVMRERDMLATQVREDSDKWTQRLSQSRSQCEYFLKGKALLRLFSSFLWDIVEFSLSHTHLQLYLY